MKRSFRVYFNERRQWVDVFVSDDPDGFLKSYDAYAYYDWDVKRKVYSGLFGSLFFYQLDDSPEGVDLINHEVEHVFADWMRKRRMVLSERNEERVALLKGAFMRSFWRGMRRWQKAQR